MSLGVILSRGGKETETKPPTSSCRSERIIKENRKTIEKKYSFHSTLSVRMSENVSESGFYDFGITTHTARKYAPLSTSPLTMSEVTDSIRYGFGLEFYSLPVVLRGYTSLQSRLRSFNEWPKYLLGPNTVDLARSGFVYQGIGDRVRCFSCGVIVKEWELADTADGEHFRWSKNCTFLSMTTDCERYK